VSLVLKESFFSVFFSVILMQDNFFFCNTQQKLLILAYAGDYRGDTIYLRYCKADIKKKVNHDTTYESLDCETYSFQKFTDKKLLSRLFGRNEIYLESTMCHLSKQLENENIKKTASKRLQSNNEYLKLIGFQFWSEAHLDTFP